MHGGRSREHVIHGGGECFFVGHDGESGGGSRAPGAVENVYADKRSGIADDNVRETIPGRPQVAGGVRSRIEFGFSDERRIAVADNVNSPVPAEPPDRRSVGIDSVRVKCDAIVGTFVRSDNDFARSVGFQIFDEIQRVHASCQRILPQSRITQIQRGFLERKRRAVFKLDVRAPMLAIRPCRDIARVASGRGVEQDVLRELPFKIQRCSLAGNFYRSRKDTGGEEAVKIFPCGKNAIARRGIAPRQRVVVRVVAGTRRARVLQGAATGNRNRLRIPRGRPPGID